MTPTALRLWVVDLGPHPPDPTGWSPLLDAVEREVAAALERDDHRSLYVARHALLRTILGEALGVAPAAVRLDRAPCPLCGGPHGRPIVVGEDAVFSLASTTGTVAVAVAPTGVEMGVEVGVDVEAAGRVGADDLVAALHPRERAALARSPSPDRDLVALRCWTRKEALLKGLGTGLGVDPAGVHVGLAPPAVDGPGGRTTTTAGPAGWTLVDLPPVPPACVVVSLAYRAARRVTVEVVEIGFSALLGGARVEVGRARA